jgi:hypothetical protein
MLFLGIRSYELVLGIQLREHRLHACSISLID